MPTSVKSGYSATSSAYTPGCTPKPKDALIKVLLLDFTSSHSYVIGVEVLQEAALRPPDGLSVRALASAQAADIPAETLC